MANRIGIRGRAIDLYVRFVDSTGEPANADDTPTVAIYDSAGILRQAATNIGVSLADDPGLYKFSYNIPLTMTDGYNTDRWLAKIGNSTVTADFAFLVISDGDISEDEEPTYTPGDDVPWDFSEVEVYGINILLKVLKFRLKNDGVRKVSDGNGGYVGVPCSVFTDAELTSFLVNSLSGFNQCPHFTQFLFSDQQIYTIFADIIIQGAVVLALAAQTLIERGREFTITDNGVSYVPPQLAEILNTQYTSQLANYNEKLKAIKLSIKPGPTGYGSLRIGAISPSYLRLRHLRERSIV